MLVRLSDVMKNSFIIKVLFVATLLSLCDGRVVEARGFDPLKSSYFTVGFGMNTYKNDAANLFSNHDMEASLTLGKWMFNSIGFRVNLTELHTTSSLSIPSFYESVEFGAFLDPIRMLRPQRLERLWSLKLYLGVGLIHRKINSEQSADNDFMGSCGINLERHIFNGFSVCGDLGMHLYPSNFDNNKTMGNVLMATIGITYKPNYTPFLYVSTSESQRLREDWYVGGALAAGSFVRLSGGLGYTPIAGADFIVGKHYTTIWEMRGRLSAGTSLSSSDKFTYANVGVDVMANLTNVFSEQRNRLWNISPYVGTGIIDNISDAEKFMFCVNGGLYIRHWLTTKSDIYMDMRALVVPPRLTPASSPIKATIGLGYIYNIGRNTCR
jgi:hypothetical protein